MKANITKRLVDSLEPQSKPYEVIDENLPGLILRVQPTGVKVFYASYRTASGNRNRMRIGNANTITPIQARDQARVILADVVKGADPAEKKRSARVHTIGTFIEKEYGPAVLEHRDSGRATQARLTACFAEFMARKLGDETLRNAITNWRSKRLKAGVKAATVNRDITALRAMFYWAVDQGFVKTNPLARFKMEYVDKRPKVRYLDADEERRLMDALDAREERIRQERDSHNAFCRERGYTEWPDLRAVPYADHLKPMVLISLGTGIRRGELFSLEWADVSFERATLTVRGETTKTETTRYVPMNSTVMEALRKWKSQTTGIGLVFPSKDGKRFDNVNTSWEAVLKEAEIGSFRWHDQRHHFASMLVMNNVSLSIVQELLGHQDPKQTVRYAHLAPQIKADAVERLVNRTQSNVIAFPKAKES